MTNFFLTIFIFLISLSNILAINLTPYRKGNKWGFANEKLEIIIKPKYKQVRIFTKLYAPVKKGNKWAYINKEGNIVTKFIYDDASIFYKYSAAVTINGKRQHINTEFKIISALGGCGRGSHWLCGAIYYSDSTLKYGILHFETPESYPEKLPPIWKSLVQIECVAGVKKDSLWGIINLYSHPKGELVIDYIYDSIYVNRFDQNLFYTKKSNLYGLINKKGEMITEPKYYKIEWMRYNCIKVWINNQFYFYTTTSGKEYFSMNFKQKRYHKKFRRTKA